MINMESSEKTEFMNEEIKIEVGDLLKAMNNVSWNISGIYYEINSIENGMVHYGLSCSIEGLIKAIKEGQYQLFKKQVVSKPKDYQVTALRCLHDGLVCQRSPINESTFEIGYFLRKDYWEIFEIKRLSDEMTFSLREALGSGGTIHSFEIDNGDLIVKINTVQGDGTWRSNLASLTKAKNKVLTTEDGVDIYANERVWWVSEMYDCDFHDFIDNDATHYPDIYKYFSSENKAKEYILENKPCLSLNDVMTALVYKSDYMNHLEKIAKERIDAKG